MVKSQFDSKLILLSGFVGGLIALFFYPYWVGDLVAPLSYSGRVIYPADNFMYQAHANTYSFASIQAPAILYKLGLSSREISLFLSFW